jgi:hypothetical protein
MHPRFDVNGLPVPYYSLKHHSDLPPRYLVSAGDARRYCPALELFGRNNRETSFEEFGGDDANDEEVMRVIEAKCIVKASEDDT